MKITENQYIWQIYKVVDFYNDITEIIGWVNTEKEAEEFCDEYSAKLDIHVDNTGSITEYDYVVKYIECPIPIIKTKEELLRESTNWMVTDEGN